MDRRVVNVLKNMPERDRFLRGMVSWAGFKQTSLPYAQSERAGSGSKYSLRKMFRFAMDGIVSFSLVPLTLATLLGLVATSISLLTILYVLLLLLFTSVPITGAMLLFIAGTFFGGMILLCLGIMGEYVGRIYRELKRRPLYVVDEVHGFQRPAEQGCRPTRGCVGRKSVVLSLRETQRCSRSDPPTQGAAGCRG